DGAQQNFVAIAQQRFFAGLERLAANLGLIGDALLDAQVPGGPLAEDARVATRHGPPAFQTTEVEVHPEAAGAVAAAERDLLALKQELAAVVSNQLRHGFRRDRAGDPE